MQDTTPLERASTALIEYLLEEGIIGERGLHVRDTTPAMRAALLTLRSPSQAMLASAGGTPEALRIWQKMIDAATASNDH
ncbi:hypothetical protein [Sphingomonas sanxanigenens]|uniref:Uncharacterized protein n=1 Tax=Sphingomonas sanxanigenens DSM 19645 = NX02 TaxID=1123269 RepID=W0A8L0_9SPHN|nr:hypothetical protein [Sphingomonas sanxanigenens]AHE52827.1 hypothetical protein NX02_05440 [Sphingomonas sanxanigenens DSM 19645 = NX02]